MSLFVLTVLEVYQFARDAAVAESWLMAHEPYLQSLDFGVSIRSACIIAQWNLSQSVLDISQVFKVFNLYTVNLHGAPEIHFVT